jgi:hypothetical protein
MNIPSSPLNKNLTNFVEIRSVVSEMKDEKWQSRPLKLYFNYINFSPYCISCVPPNLLSLLKKKSTHKNIHNAIYGNPVTCTLLKISFLHDITYKCSSTKTGLLSLSFAPLEDTLYINVVTLQTSGEEFCSFEMFYHLSSISVKFLV